MSFALVVNGYPVHHEQDDAVVPWWSFTKTVLAAASLSLVRDGLVRLDDWVPEGPFTLRQLLRHEAGLADYGELAEYHEAVARGDTPWPPAEMERRLGSSSLRYTPGNGWQYSNVGYMFVTRLIERVTRLPLEEALTRRVFAPLGFSRIRLARNQSDLDGVCMGDASTYDPGWVYHGLLVGPLSEAALLLDRLLEGHLHSIALLQEMRTARTLEVQTTGRPWTTPGYGLGLMQSATEGGLSFCGHTGAGPGSVVAVYRCVHADAVVSCAVFQAGFNQGTAETEVVGRVSAILVPENSRKPL